LPWEVEHDHWLRNGMKVCIKTMATTHEGYDWLYSGDTGYLYYDQTCAAHEAQWTVERLVGSGDYITKFDRIILRNNRWTDDVIYKYSGDYLVSDDDYSDKILT